MAAAERQLASVRMCRTRRASTMPLLKSRKPLETMLQLLYVTSHGEKSYCLTNDSLQAAVFNASGFGRKPFLETTEEDFMGGINVSALGAFLFSKATLPLLLKGVEAGSQYPPTLIFTGATASIKGSARFGPFAAGKFAKRALAQSLAREFMPQGIHVAHVIVDGVIDIPRTKEWMQDAGPDAKMSPDAIADHYWYLHSQPRSTMTVETDVRPWVEKW